MSDITPMVAVPSEVNYGRIRANFVAFIADDNGNVLEEVPLEGNVILTPTVGVLRFPSTSPPRTAVIQTLQCPIIGGILYPPGTPLGGPFPSQTGVAAVASDQPAGMPTTVQWTASFSLKNTSAQPNPVTFEVPTGGVVDLTTVLPTTPEPGLVVVVSTESRDRAEAAADTAASSAVEAASSAVLATQKAAAAASSASAADDAMQAASGAASDADQSRVGAAASALAASVAEQAAVAAQEGLVAAREAAAGSASSAATSASNAASSANAAATARSGAEAAAATATQNATAAASSATSAATSASSAATSAGEAAVSASQATQAAAGIAAHGQIRYDTVSGRYSNASIQGFFAAKANARVYGVSIPKSLATACTKTGANAGIDNPTPSTIAQPGSDPYTAHTPFFTLEVNGGVEEDGTPFVTAIQGDKHFRRDGSNGDVWVMAPVLYWQMEEEDEAVELQVSDSPLAGFTVQPKGLLPSGARRPYMLYAKYALSIVDGVARSISGRPVAVRNVSHNSLITQCKNATTGYSGKSFADDWYMKTMFLLKYATKNSQSVYAGVTSMYSHPFVTMAESETNRVVVATSAAEVIPVGATITLGTNVPEATGRGPAATFDIFDMRRVVDKVAVDSSNTALVVEGPSFTVQMGYRVYTMPWATGGCDRVVGDGSPTSPTSGREPFVLQGIELALGMYESLGDVILSNLGTGQEVCLLPDSRLAATSVTANYRRTGKYLPNQAAISWTYPTYPANVDGLLIGADVGASTSAGMCDGQYLDAVTTQGTRQWLSLGYLLYGSLAGVWIVDANAALSSAGWVIGSRLSAIGRAKLEDN